MTLFLNGSVELSIGTDHKVISNDVYGPVTFSIVSPLGEQMIDIRALDNSTLGDLWMVNGNESVGEVLQAGSTPVLSSICTSLSETSWKITTNSTGPFMLDLSMPYDKGWKATVNGVQVAPVQIDGSIVGFWINMTGPLNIVVNYGPQSTYNIGLYLGIGTFMFVGVAIIYWPLRSKISRYYHNKKV